MGRRGRGQECGETSPSSLRLTPTPNNADEPGLSTSATIVVHFLKASPVPRLAVAPGPSRHLCTPRQDYGVVVSGASEDPDQANRHGPYSFALGPNPTVQRDWRLQPFNGTCLGKGMRLWRVDSLGSEMGRGVVGEQFRWRLSRLVTLIIFCNPTDSHAYLTLALHWVEPGEYMVPVVVHHDAQMWQLQVQGEAGT